MRSAHRKATRTRCASLEDVLAYRNPRVVRGFLRDYDLERGEATLLFREMLRLLWLVGSTGRFPGIWPPWTPLDDMWHAFLLHTKDYRAFCLRYFGRMIHHDPATDPRTAKAKADPKRMARELTRAIDLVWDRLGPETADLWFRAFWDRYTPRFLDRHVKRPSAKIARRAGRGPNGLALGPTNRVGS